MEWKEIKITTLEKYEDIFSFILYQNGATGLDIHDPRDIEYIRKDPESWSVYDEKDFADEDQLIIKAYFEASEADSIFDKIKLDIQENELISKDSYHIEESIVRETDWSENWKQYYKPVKIGKKILVCPEWEKDDNEEDRSVIFIDPGMAFGTGTHETTKLCLEAIEDYVKLGDTIFDVGTGSGILSVAAVSLGAKKAIAVDIDELAIKMAHQNVLLNHMEDAVLIKKGNLLDAVEGEANIIVSNIIAEIICTMIGDLREHLLDGGIFITSGIIEEKVPMVLTALSEHSFIVVESRSENGWHLIVARK